MWYGGNLYLGFGFLHLYKKDQVDYASYYLFLVKQQQRKDMKEKLNACNGYMMVRFW